MKIGDEVYIHGYVDEIRKDTIIVRNDGGYFGTVETEIRPVEEEPKTRTGHWIDIMVGDMPAQACDQCKTFYPLAYIGGGHRFCPNCGAKMESEGK